jgi:hypothetical protein
MADPTEDAVLDPWFRTTSPEEAIHLCSTAFYPHRLRLLGQSTGFGLSQRVTQLGPVTVGDITYQTDVDWVSTSLAPATTSAFPSTAGSSRAIAGST